MRVIFKKNFDKISTLKILKSIFMRLELKFSSHGVFASHNVFLGWPH